MGKGMKNLKIKSFLKDNFKGNLSTKHQTALGGGGGGLQIVNGVFDQKTEIYFCIPDI